MLRRIASAAIVGAALLTAFGCGSSGNDASVDSGPSREHAVSPAADPNPSGSSTVSANGLRTVTYRGVQFDVPADWPVHDLAADPSTCVRFDEHAVYLGTPGADMNCPAGIVGRVDTVLVEPTAGSSRHAASESNDASAATATASGLEVQVATDSASTGEVAADVPSAGVSVSLTYGDSDATAQQILQSFRTAS